MRGGSARAALQLNLGVGQQRATCYATFIGDDPWVVSNGGPLLLLPAALLPAWSGTEVPADGRVLQTRFRWDPDAPAPSDYDRACDVAGYAGVLDVADGWGLVLGDEPNSTRWLPGRGGGVLVRWVYAENDVAVEAALVGIPGELAWTPLGQFTVATSPLVLFDAADPGDLGDGYGLPRASIEVSPGRYDVAHADYAPDAQTALSLVRLRAA